MSFDWGLFWQQTQNEAITALVLFPTVVLAFVVVWWLRRR